AAEVHSELGRLLSDGRAPVAERSESPFRGLSPFSEQHAAFFFGREPEVAAFVERLRQGTVLPVVGPSGAGKSSFVEAGVLARVREQRSWTVLSLGPGAQPFVALAQRLVTGERSTHPTGQPTSPNRPRASHSPPSPAIVDALARELEQAPERLSLRL